MLLVVKFLSLTFSALLPVINPLGSALIFLSLVGMEPDDVFRKLSRRVALASAFFLIAVDLGGAAFLAFFGISLPIVQLAGGFALAAMGWKLLNKEDVPEDGQVSTPTRKPGSLEELVFYPLTFPLTVGPGCIVVMLTLSAQASKARFAEELLSQAGMIAGIVALSLVVFLSYAYSEKITQKVTRQTAHGVLRVIAFILLCIGAQIAWNGLEALVRGMGKA